MARTILTVDDSRSIRGALRETLEDLGFEVLEAEDGEQGFAVLAASRVDVLITDLNMPRLDGLGLIRRVRADGRFPGLPIVMLTTESQPGKMREGREAGASGWIVKPFNELQIEMVVRKFAPVAAAAR
ncbi:MAG: response regulator [Paracoccaceae bacterium]